MDQAWRLTSQSPLLWRAWDGEMVVYSDASGDTHHLDALGAEAFEALLGAPATLLELRDRLSGSLGVEPTAELSNALAALIRRFVEFGLIEPVT